MSEERLPLGRISFNPEDIKPSPSPSSRGSPTPHSYIELFGFRCAELSIASSPLGLGLCGRPAFYIFEGRTLCPDHALHSVKGTSPVKEFPAAAREAKRQEEGESIGTVSVMVPTLPVPIALPEDLELRDQVVKIDNIIASLQAKKARILGTGNPAPISPS